MDAATAEKICLIRERVAHRIGTNRYRTWFAESTDFELSGDQLGVTVANEFVGSWIASNFLPDIAEAFRDVLGVEPRIDVRVTARPDPCNGNGQAHPAPSKRDGTPPPRTVRSRDREAVPLRGDLESFVVGTSNALAYAAACHTVRSPGDGCKLLVVHGGCGLGKTHLLQGICNGVHRTHPTMEWRYVSGEEFTNEFIYAVRGGHLGAFRARFRKVQVLVIDDIHFLADKKATQEEFLHTFNAIDACGKAVVLSSDRHPRTIATLSEPLINRLISGMVVGIAPPDFATRREILRRRAAAMGCAVPDDVFDLIAHRVTRNVRELEGVLYKLSALSSLAKEPVTTALTQLALEDYGAHAGRKPQAAEIERTVAHYFGLTREVLHSRARDRTASLARGIAMFLIRRHTRLSFPEIGRLMGNKNHSTVVMAIKRIEQILGHDGAVQWTSSSGKHEATLSELLRRIEQEVARGRD